MQTGVNWKLLSHVAEEGYEPVTEDAGHDAEVAEDGHQDYPAQDADLLGNMKTFLDILDILRYFRHF